MAIILKNIADTINLGKFLACCLQEGKPPAIFMRGGMGSGKTTLTRAIVDNMPNGKSCEFASPSFTICNLYPASPPVLHCDLFRCHSILPEEIYEAIDDSQTLVIVEWAEFYPAAEMPKEYLDISFKIVNDLRLIEVSGSGMRGIRLAQRLIRAFPAC